MLIGFGGFGAPARSNTLQVVTSGTVTQKPFQAREFTATSTTASSGPAVMGPVPGSQPAPNELTSQPIAPSQDDSMTPQPLSPSQDDTFTSKPITSQVATNQDAVFSSGQQIDPSIFSQPIDGEYAVSSEGQAEEGLSTGVVAVGLVAAGAFAFFLWKRNKKKG